ncbi:MAG TPA: amylo-alpha-1,6-glucosidase [Devosia sp.]|nr:amylo-alpha-1,6-glucosidase [Devosia sp.]
MKSDMLPLKNDHCYAVLDANGMATAGHGGVVGFFFHDSRHLSKYTWDMSGLDLIHQDETLSVLSQYWSRFANHEQQILIRRTVTLLPEGVEDRLVIENSGRNEQYFTPVITLGADFADLFEARGRTRATRKNPVERIARKAGRLFRYLAQDGAELSTDITFSGDPVGVELLVPARGTRELCVNARFSSSSELSVNIPVQFGWSAQRAIQQKRRGDLPGLAVAYEDIEALALSTRSGTCIAAGVPNFVAMFGRDSLITAWFLLEQAPKLAEGVLRFLAHHQGRKFDPFRDEQPGKILHEYREGELSRLNELPFSAYYGSVDATALFVRLLADYVNHTGNEALAIELEANWRAALDWIERERDERGLLRYRGATDGKGLINKSWKDSDDSMSFGNGSLPTGSLAVVEVQGYVFAAFQSGASLNRIVGGQQNETARLLALSEATSTAIERHFWMPEHQIYALGLDERGKRLNVVSSDPGHLLWAGAVPEGRLDGLVKRMFAPDLWSGWGLRTLGTREKRYNPLSYHNGSVWPHDTALFGAGLFRYGRREEFERVANALTDLASARHDHRLPELISGYQRDSGSPPLPYVESCRPQAWAAAALIYAAHPHRAEKRLSGATAVA